MNYFTGKRMNTVGHIISAAVDDGQMDCEDDARVHVWVVCSAWSTRRAFLTDGAPFLRAQLTAGVGDHGHGISDDYVTALLADERYVRELRLNVERHVTGRFFYVELIGPPDEAEPGERIEIISVRPTPPREEVERRLGIR